MDCKVYLQNPYLEDLESKVLKKYQKNGMYYMILDRTIFHPRHSSVSIIDKGTINGFKIIDVFVEKENIIHVLKENIASKDVALSIDWNMRFDYMQQHTGQHILSASLNKLCQVDTIEFYFDQSCAYITIDNVSLNASDISRIEKFANHMIYSNFQMKSSFDKQNDESKRKISIDDIYITDCNSIHCSSTGEVGSIKIIDYSKDEDGIMKLKFVCGSRALKDYTFKDDLISKISGLLSVDEKDLYEKIEQILETNKRLEDEIKI